ncbi:MAG: manganese efflux pump MntP family protein [Lachnospiraceae bacterium]|nr:manganese efflux pump MntP family protein [Lachnospiraceae bacterium]
MVLVINSILLGIGLAMDAFSVSVANGLNEPAMKKGKMNLIAGTFAFFQALMPLIGWFLLHTVVHLFNSFEKFVPWIGFILLSLIGSKMVVEGIKNKECIEKSEDTRELGHGALIIQGVATSIDALSAGAAMVEYDAIRALIAALIIAAVTFLLCMIAVRAGKKIGSRFAGPSSIFGGLILIAIGIEILVTGALG